MKKYLYEVQGLRTVAALMVAVYHIWFDRVSGGVDVFFVIAAFFLTRSLLRLQDADAGRARWAAVGRNWLRTARRILPSAVVVIVASVIGVMLFVPRVLWNTEVNHAIASLGMAENLYLARISVDYLNRDLGASVFQQFWALGLQVQFYLLWPLVMCLLVAVAQRLRVGVRPVLLAGFAVVAVVSFVASVVMTAADQVTAYYLPVTRAWEFAVGALVALWTVRTSNGRAWGIVGWAALVGLVGFAAVFDASGRLPGYLALAPVGCAVLLLLAAQTSAQPAILRWRPLQVMASSSFAFYLWHWPLLVLYRQITRTYDVGVLPGLGIILVAGVLAWGTTRLVETPFRSAARLNRSAVPAVIACVGLMVPAVAAVGVFHQRTGSLVAEAKTLVASFDSAGAADRIVPSPIIARDDLPPGYANGCHQNETDPEVIGCEYGNPAADTVIALVGGSHSLQWLPALDRAGSERGWRIVSYTKSACVFGDAEVLDDADPSCPTWQSRVLDEIVGLNPDLAVTLATRGENGTDEVPGGYLRYFDRLDAAGIPVLGIQDNPWWSADPVVCLERHPDDHGARCAIDRIAAYPQDRNSADAVGGSVTFFSVADLLCRDSTCPAVLDSVLVYRDDNHLTRTWVRSMSAQLGDAVAAAMER